MKKPKAQANPVAPVKPPPEVVAEAPAATHSMAVQINSQSPQDAAVTAPASVPPAAALQSPEDAPTEVAPPVPPVELAAQQGAAVISEKANEPQAEHATITVVGPAKGRWRAGRKFGPEATVISLGDLTEAQVTALASDPELVVALSA